MIVLDPSQVEDLALIEANDFTALLAIEPGGGKTVEAAEAIRRLSPDTALISAPFQTLRYDNRGWLKDEYAEIMGSKPRVIGRKNKAQQQALADFEWGVKGIYIATPQFLSHKNTDISGVSGDMLVVDEVHQVCTYGTSSQRRFSGATPKENQVSLSSRFDHRLALSGSPMRQHFPNMWSTMRLLWPELDQRREIADFNHYTWLRDRMTSKEIFTSRRDKNGNPMKATQYLVERVPGLLMSQMPCVVSHKRRENCCIHHPNGFLSTEKPNEIFRVVDLHPKQLKAISEMEKHLMTFIDENPLIAGITLTQKQRLRQLCLGVPSLIENWQDFDDEGNIRDHQTIHWNSDSESPFLDEVVQIMDELGTEEPVVIHLGAQKFAEIVVNRLRKHGITAEEYSGVRKANLADFGEKFQVLVGVTSALGTGTDGLQEQCNTEIWLEIPVSLTDKEQAEARLDRRGGKQVQRFYVFDSTGYAEGRFSDMLETKLRVASSLRKVV